MGSCREILTVQLGNYANHVGAHFWNLQETSFKYDETVKSEICHDILYREGVSFQGHITFTPRVVCIGNMKGLAPIPLLEEPEVDVENLANEGLQNFETETVNQHAFIKDLDVGADTTTKDYDFENTLRDWGDLLRGRLHPRSIVAPYKENDEDMEDKVRMFIEECDNLQGFHILLDCNESHSNVLTYLEDEFSSKSRLAFPVIAGAKESTGIQSATRLIQIFSNFYDSANSSSLTVPLGCSKLLSLKLESPTPFQNLVFDAQCHYHTSAVLAAFLDTFSVSYRRQTKESEMFDSISGLTSRNCKFSGASLALPFPISPGLTLQETLEARDDLVPLWSSLTPGANLDNSWYQTFGLRGTSEGNTFLQYLQFISSSVSTVSAVSNPIPIVQPFPKIFSKHVSMRGSVDPTASRMPGFEVHSTPALAGLHSSSGVGKMLNELTTLITKINVRKLPNINIETDLFEERVDSMYSLAKSFSLDDELL